MRRIRAMKSPSINGKPRVTVTPPLRAITTFADREHDVYEPSEEELASLEGSLAEADRGAYATDVEVAALWTKRDL